MEKDMSKAKRNPCLVSTSSLLSVRATVHAFPPRGAPRHHAQSEVTLGILSLAQ